MPAQKILTQNNGVITEVAPGVTGGATDANKIAAYDANGQLPMASMPTGIGADVAMITASEALAAGNYVNVWSNAGAFAVRKADGSTSGKEAHGFVLAAVASNAAATVYFEGTNGQVTGQTPGRIYLSATTPGAGAAAAPSGSGQVVQVLGFAVSATAVNFQSEPAIVLA